MHPTATELHDAAYGFAPMPPHVADCAMCMTAVEAIRAEHDALRAVLQDEAPVVASTRHFPGWVAAAGIFFGVVVLLIVTRPAPDRRTPIQEEPQRKPTLAELVEKFANGDDGVRDAIKTAGPAAMHLLLPRRGTKRIDALREEIRRAAADEDSRYLHALFYSDRFSKSLKAVPAAEALREIAHISFDPGDPALAGKPVTLELDDTFRDAIDKVCARIGADFAYLYGYVLIAAPDRLWAKKPIEVVLLGPDDAKRVREHMACLADESPEVRDDACAQIRRLGSGAIDILLEGTKSADPEVASRCKALIEELRPQPPAAVFGRPAVERQKLDDKGAKTLRELRERVMSFKVKDLWLKTTLALLAAQYGSAAIENSREVFGDIPGAKITWSVESGPMWSTLCLLTQAYGLDFIIQNGDLVIGPNEEIRKRAGLK